MTAHLSEATINDLATVSDPSSMFCNIVGVPKDVPMCRALQKAGVIQHVSVVHGTVAVNRVRHQGAQEESWSSQFGHIYIPEHAQPICFPEPRLVQ